MKKTNFLMAMALVVSLVFGASNAYAQIGGLGKTIKSAASGAASSALAEKVSVEKIPATLEEFKTLQAEIGDDPQGCVMLQLLAMEMYRRDKEVGLQCLTLVNTDVNLSSVVRRLNELYREGDSYARPYLVASCFKGAKPSNGYNPDKPYTIRVRRDPVNSKDERSQMLKGYVKHLQVYSDGYDTPWRGVDVVKQKGDDYYRVSNCPAILTQCKEVDFDSSEEWHGLE